MEKLDGISQRQHVPMWYVVIGEAVPHYTATKLEPPCPSSPE